jgi:pimeloyl-ACP methyl ester carboxylesterase
VPPENSAKPPVVFVHGLWLHAESWKPWIDLFRQNGYEAIAVGWPGDGPTTDATRKNPFAVAGYGVEDIAAHIAGQIKGLKTKPVLIGHSFGGLLVPILLGRDLASAAIAIDPAPMRGVWELPLSTLKSGFPVLGNPGNLKKAVSLTAEQFRYGFTNAVAEDEAKRLFEKFAMPGPGRPLFQAAMATFNPYSETRVNVTNASRGPLLLIAGAEDHTVPPVLVRSALRRYRLSLAVTEIKEFAGRGHSLTIDSGWKEIADACLGWLKEKKLG